MLLSREKIIKLNESYAKYTPGLRVWIHFPITEDLIQCNIEETTRDKVLLSVPEDSDLYGAPKFWLKKVNIVGIVEQTIKENLEQITYRKQEFPSEVFGKKTGLDWIYTEWKLPIDDRDEAGYKIMEWQNDETKLKEFYNALLELNPELKKLNSHKIYDVCYGAISKFNYDDIDFYSSSDRENMLTYNTNIGSLKNGLVTKFKTEIYWVPSPKTLGKLQDIVSKTH